MLDGRADFRAGAGVRRGAARAPRGSLRGALEHVRDARAAEAGGGAAVEGVVLLVGFEFAEEGVESAQEVGGGGGVGGGGDGGVCVGMDVD